MASTGSPPSTEMNNGSGSSSNPCMMKYPERKRQVHLGLLRFGETAVAS